MVKKTLGVVVQTVLRYIEMALKTWVTEHFGNI